MTIPRLSIPVFVHLFGRHFVKTELISRELGDLFNDLYEARQEVDYVDLVEVDPDILPEWIAGVKNFIQAISILLQRSSE